MQETVNLNTMCMSQVGVFSATLPPEALEITRKFMNKPVSPSPLSVSNEKLDSLRVLTGASHFMARLCFVCSIDMALTIVSDGAWHACAGAHSGEA